MAVPKSKRYRQVTRSRRSALDKIKLSKKSLNWEKNSGFYVNKVSPNVTLCHKCGSEKAINGHCVDCYMYYWESQLYPRKVYKLWNKNVKIRLPRKEWNPKFPYLTKRKWGLI